MALKLGSLTPSKLYIGATEATRAYLGATEVYSTGGGPALWTPADLGAGLALWLDADDASTITLNGSTVSQWDDKSGNGRNATQTTTANQPGYAPGSVTFLGSDGLIFASALPSAWTGYFVGTPGSNTFFRAILTSAASNVPVLINQNSNALGSFAGGFGQAGTLTWDTSEMAFVGARTYASSNTLMNKNGGTYFSTNRNANDAAVSIGNALPIAAILQFGAIHETVVASGDLSEIDRQKLEGYLAWKWGLEANLPSGHPFKSSPPTA